MGQQRSGPGAAVQCRRGLRSASELSLTGSYRIFTARQPGSGTLWQWHGLLGWAQQLTRSRTVPLKTPHQCMVSARNSHRLRAAHESDFTVCFRGADVMYIDDAVAPLVETLRAVSGANTLIYIAHGRNRQAEASFRVAAEKQFEICEVPGADLDELYQCSDVTVLRLRLRLE